MDTIRYTIQQYDYYIPEKKLSPELVAKRRRRLRRYLRKQAWYHQKSTKVKEANGAFESFKVLQKPVQGRVVIHAVST